MKPVTTTLMFILAAFVPGALRAQGFSSGSDGSYGPMNIAANTTLDMPANGKFNCTTITVAQGVTLKFNRDLLNTPVYLLATGDVTINGSIDVSGRDASGSPPVGGLGGPGGFDGGLPGIDTSSIPPGSGYGPGAGKGGPANISAANAVGAAGYGSVGSGGASTNHGGLYGSPLLVPLVGGSGGGGGTGSPGGGGGGGGGAVLIASNTKIIIGNNAHLNSIGGYNSGSGYGGGSGGAIRLVAPVITGTGSLDVSGRSGGGYGRIRIDAIDRSTMNLGITPASASSAGAAMFLFPNPLPRLDVVQAAGTAIPEGSPNPVVVVLPFGANPSQSITVQGRDFTGVVPINVVLTPENGVPTTYPAQINMSSGNPASTVVNVTLPVNVRTIVNAWTR
jgi:hypothetical protein